MTVYFQDTFTGNESLSGHSPDVPFIGIPLWTGITGNSQAVSGGYMAQVSPPYTYTAASATNGVVGSAYGATGDVQVEFTFVTPPDITTLQGPIYLQIWLNGITVMGGIRSTNTGGFHWALTGTGSDSDIDITASLAPSTTYTGVFQLKNGASTFTLLGQVRNFTDVWVDATGVNKLMTTIGGYSKISEIKITSVASPTSALCAAPTVLGAPHVLVDSAAYLLPRAIGAAASPLGLCQVRVLHDFTGLLGDAATSYVMDLITPTGLVRVPVSSWQATLQTGSSNYVQCVVPACTAWVDTINAATEFVVSRRAVLPSGSAVTQEMARAPADTAQFDRGASRHTCTISGYSTAFAANATPDAAYDRTLMGLRSVSSGSKLRVRCAIDWLLRPGQRAFADGVPLLVEYINYYVPSNGDAYMDVGGPA